MHSPEQEGKTEPKMIFPELLTLHSVCKRNNSFFTFTYLFTVTEEDLSLLVIVPYEKKDE